MYFWKSFQTKKRLIHVLTMGSTIDLYVTSERIIKGQNKMIKLIEELYK